MHDQQIERHGQHEQGKRSANAEPVFMPPLTGFEPLWRRMLQHDLQSRAIEYRDTSWTYGHLLAQSGQLAGYFAARYPVESLIAVSLPRTPELVAVLLGILRAGCAFLPIDPKYPIERIRFMLQDAQPACVITDQRDLGLFPSQGPVVTTHDILASSHSLQPPDRLIGPNQLAYAIYTSGSTGVPKAALLEHRGLTNLVREQCRIFRVTPVRRVLQFSSIGFDASVSEIFVTLHAGATLCLAPEAELTPGPRLASLLARKRITDVTLPPSVLTRLGDVTLPDLQTLVVAGEACSVRLVKQWSAGRTMINAYGPTEATVCVSTATCRAESDVAPTIGLPIGGVETYILDPDGNPASEGELYVGGIGLARGYLGRPELNAQKFVTRPIQAGQPATRLYRTGDRVRQDHAGVLTFLGRIDDEVKLNGVRIDLGEIQARLERDSQVQQATVCLETTATQSRLLGFVQWRLGASMDWDRLWEDLRSFLPVSHWPAELIPVESFPLTPNGKVDRARLLQAADSYRHGTRQTLRVVRFDAVEATSEPTLGSVLSQLRDCWRAVLPHSPLHPDADFFLQGGDSLSAMELLARVHDQFGSTISIAEFVRRPTLQGLATHLSSEAPVPSPHTNLIALHQSSSNRVLVCVHPGGGHVLCYHPLARALQPEWNVYGLQADGVDGREAPQRTLASMADKYTTQIEAAFPGQSISLLGWSLGGLVAYEMMTRLKSSSKVCVDQFWVVDAAPLYSLVVLRSLFPDPKLSLRKILSADRNLLCDAFAQIAVNAFLVPPRCPPHELAATFQVFMANVEATLGYRPPRYQGRMNLLLAEEGCPGMHHDVAAEWKAVTSDVRVQYSEGAHLTLLQEPYVQEIARRIRLASIVAIPQVRRRAA